MDVHREAACLGTLEASVPQLVADRVGGVRTERRDDAGTPELVAVVDLDGGLELCLDVADAGTELIL